jgi:hypothetical protein
MLTFIFPLYMLTTLTETQHDTRRDSRLSDSLFLDGFTTFLDDPDTKRTVRLEKRSQFVTKRSVYPFSILFHLDFITRRRVMLSSALV